MAEFLFGAAAFILAMVALGLVRVLRGPADADLEQVENADGHGGTPVKKVACFNFAKHENTYRCMTDILTGQFRRVDR